MNYIELVCVVDRSGSMASIRDDAIGERLNIRPEFTTNFETSKEGITEVALHLDEKVRFLRRGR